MEMNNEKRRLMRYSVPDGEFFVFNPIGLKLGKMLDISGRGVAFEYIPINFRETEFEKTEPLNVDIFKYDESFCLGKACPVVAFRRSRIAQAKNLYFLLMSVCVCG